MNPYFSPRKEIELFWLKPRDLFVMSLSALGLTWDGYRCVWIPALPKGGSWSIKLDCWFLKGLMGKGNFPLQQSKARKWSTHWSWTNSHHLKVKDSSNPKPKNCLISEDKGTAHSSGRWNLALLPWNVFGFLTKRLANAFPTLQWTTWQHACDLCYIVELTIFN